MKAKKILAMFLVFVIIAAAFFAAKKIYFHEHEINSRLAEIKNGVDRIAEDIKKEETPLSVSDREHFYKMLTSKAVLNQTEYDAYMGIACGKDINILVVGDSISALDWPTKLAEWISFNYGINCNIKNISMGGNTSYAGYVRANMLSDDFNFDLAILCFGQNDEEENFSIYYESVIRSILQNRRCTLISVLESSQRRYTSKMNEIIQLADYYGIAVADTIKAFEDSELSYESLAPDGVHPREKGQEVYLRVFANIICEKVSEAVKQIADYYLYNQNPTLNQNICSIKPPANEDVVFFEKECYYPTEEFERIDDCTFQIELNSLKGLPGIYMTRIPGENSVIIDVNGRKICEYSEEFSHSFSQEIIHLFEDCYLNTEEAVLKVSFSDKNQADGFFGLMVSNNC